MRNVYWYYYTRRFFRTRIIDGFTAELLRSYLVDGKAKFFLGLSESVCLKTYLSPIKVHAEQAM